MKFHLLLFFILFIVANRSCPAFAAPPQEKIRILFIFDASQSMLSNWQSGKKIDGAKKILNQLVDSLQKIENVDLALRIYGHQSYLRAGYTKDCKDSKLEVPFAPRNHSKVKSRISEIIPKGTTPIAYSLEQSADDFAGCETCRNIIILITDGLEECDGDPCAISLLFQKKGISIRSFIIGIGLGPEVEAFDCVGKYYDSNNEESFLNALQFAVNEAIHSTTAQVDLLDTGKRPTETNVVMTFYERTSGTIKYNYVHSLNHKGNPDTLVLDHDLAYEMTVHTLPEIHKEKVVLKKGEHNTIPLDAGQGSLLLKAIGYNEFKSLKTVVRKSGSLETINVQEPGKTQRYLTGKYDLEILTLPRIYVPGVEIKQSHTTTIEIPSPGIASIVLPAVGFASLYLEEETGLKWIYNIEENKTKKNLTLQPGNYRIVYRSVNSKESIYTVERSFKMESGGSVSVQLK